MKSLPAAGLSIALCIILSGCGSTDGANDDEQGSSSDALSVTSSFTSKATGYYPDGSALEGGFVDRRGVKLRTLQQFLAGQADYVAVAMDSSAFPYGQHLRIKELDAKYGRAIDFRVVDTGGAFRGRGAIAHRYLRRERDRVALALGEWNGAHRRGDRLLELAARIAAGVAACIAAGVAARPRMFVRRSVQPGQRRRGLDLHGGELRGGLQDERAVPRLHAVLRGPVPLSLSPL